jgi:peptide/nickel transport system ATP-binding protein
MTAEPLLVVDDLSVDFLTPSGPVRALDRVSFSIHRGEFLGLAGESGSGKSTLVHAIMRTLGPPAVITGGSVRLLGQDLLTLDDTRLRQIRWKQISLVFQSAMDALNPVLTVGAQILDTLLAHDPKTSRKTHLARVRDLLDLVGIDPRRIDSYPHELSGGMRQRVAIALALALSPALLLMDEPTTALDVIVERKILETLEALKTQLGFSILFITHDLPLMLDVTDRLGILYAGRLVELAPTETLAHHPAHPYTRGLLRAFPRLDGPLEPLSGIPGSPPSLASPPSGCRFHPRCPLAIPACALTSPALTPRRGPDHLVACDLTLD